MHAFELDILRHGRHRRGGASEGGGGGADFPAPYIYKVPNTRVKQSGVNVNAGSARAFRAPGHPTASFGMESIMDELAVKLNMDPVELRIKNDPFREFAKKNINSARKDLVGRKNIKSPAARPATSRPASVAPAPPGAAAAGALKPKRKSIRTAASRFVAARRIWEPAQERYRADCRRTFSA